jgi:hypothetical protein
MELRIFFEFGCVFHKTKQNQNTLRVFIRPKKDSNFKTIDGFERRNNSFPVSVLLIIGHVRWIPHMGHRFNSELKIERIGGGLNRLVLK